MNASIGSGRAAVTLTSVDAQCRREGDALVMSVAVRGEATGEGVSSGEASVPIRVAVVGGERVLYSNLGRQAINLAGGRAAFTYVDDDIRIPASGVNGAQVFAGFDEMN